jgi:tetratricopeptide (TPR) repeat protein
MSHAINIGLDLGSTSWRAAYLNGDEVVSLPLFEGEDHAAHLLRCQSDHASALPVCFPSVKMLVGADDYLPAAAEATPEELIGSWLSTLVRVVERQSGGVPGQLVIAVPALYPSSRRTAIRDLALAAGFADVHLLNDSMAAVIAHHHGSDASALMLVYGLGYSGFEIGVIRMFRGRYRAVAYDGGTSLGGARFDAMIMRSCLQLLLAQKLWSPSHKLSADAWLRFRRVVQNIKESFSEKEVASLQLNLPGADRAVPPLQMSRLDFEQGAAAAAESTFDTIDHVLQEAELTIDDIDGVLLNGGCIAIGSIASALCRRFERPVTVLGRDAIARGAAIYASQLKLIPASDTPLVQSAEERSTAEELPVLKVTLSSLTQTAGEEIPLAQYDAFADGGSAEPRGGAFELMLEVVEDASRTAVFSTPRASGSRPEGSLEAIAASRENLFRQLRILAEQGSRNHAQAQFQAVIEEAQAALALLAEAGPAQGGTSAISSGGIPPHIQSVLDRAREFLAAGRFQQAVEQSHVAYSMAKENPDVFSQMIKVHVDAAAAHSSDEGYEKSIEWLMCARGHDPTNSEIHGWLADRHFQHARAMAQIGQNEKALATLDECLFSNPMHEEAEKLRIAISSANGSGVGRGSNGQ